MTFNRAAIALAASTLPSVGSANAQVSDIGVRPSAGIELFASTDSDKTDVLKLLAKGALMDDGADRYRGVVVERALFTPQGQHTRQDERFYLEAADKAGSDWLWRAKIGTDGHSWLGSANVHAKDWSKEVFIEREIVETPRGVDEGIYYTFVGASLDLPASDRDIFTATAGIQEFTGKNERLHLRGNYTRVLRPKVGLTAQLRARYFHSTAPGEFDYYSPKNFVQLLPVLQMRRFTSTGWMVLGAAGYGVQRATGGSWQSARLAEVRVESPRSVRGFRLFGQVQYSNNSLSGSGNYDYVIGRFGLSTRF